MITSPSDQIDRSSNSILRRQLASAIHPKFIFLNYKWNGGRFGKCGSVIFEVRTSDVSSFGQDRDQMRLSCGMYSSRRLLRLPGNQASTRSAKRFLVLSFNGDHEIRVTKAYRTREEQGESTSSSICQQRRAKGYIGKQCIPAT